MIRVRAMTAATMDPHCTGWARDAPRGPSLLRCARRSYESHDTPGVADVVVPAQVDGHERKPSDRWRARQRCCGLLPCCSSVDVAEKEELDVKAASPVPGGSATGTAAPAAYHLEASEADGAKQ
jgi:hypothetical protein